MSVCCFVADVHLGLDYNDPKGRETLFVSTLKSLPDNLTDLYLLGDIFDFWYEYKDVIPSGYTRTLGALSELSDRGVKIHFFNGNHDIWTYRYFQKELNITVETKPAVVEIDGKSLFLGHGDNLWDKSNGYKLLQKVFKSKIVQTLFSALHPRWAFLFGKSWSKHNRLTHNMSHEQYEELKSKISRQALEWAKEYRQQTLSKPIDYFITAHYHTPFEAQIEGGGEFFMLGDWIHHPDYILLDSEGIRRICAT